jgi:hypothetical protein
MVMTFLASASAVRLPFRFLFALEMWWIVLSLFEQHTGFRL